MTQPLGEAFVTIRPDLRSFQSEATRGLQRQLAATEQSLTAFNRTTSQTPRHLRNLEHGAFAASLGLTGLRGAVLSAGVGFLAGAGLVQGIGLLVSSAADLERTMNQLQAVTQATSEQMNRAGQVATELGRDFTLPSVSASDAAEAMTELARAGLDVEESMEGARGVLQLAAAANASNAEAAQIAGRSIQAFNLEASESGRVADVLANAANVSTGEIGDFAISLQQSSAVANQFGLSIEQTVAGLTLLANAGISGSDAGTSLRVMLLRLIPTTKEAADLTEDLGIRTTTASGAIRPFPEIIDSYRQALARLTPEQRQAALTTIFGSDAIRAANIIFAQGEAGFLRATSAVSRQGAAADLAAAKNRGLTGSLDALVSNLQTIGLSVGGRIVPAFTTLVQSINSGVTALQNSEEVQQTASEVASGFAEVTHELADAARETAPLLEGLASAAGAVTRFVGAAPLIAGIAAFKIFPGIARLGQRAFLALGNAANFATGNLVREIPAAQGVAAAQTSAAATAGGLVAAQNEAAISAGRLTAAESTLARSLGATFTEIEAVTVATNQLAAAQARAAASGAGGAAGGVIGAGGGAAAGFERITRTQRVVQALGGTFGIASIAAGALAVGLTLIPRRAQGAEAGIQSLREATDALASGISDARDATDQLQDAQLSIAQGRLRIETAQLARATAEQALQQAIATGNTRDRARAEVDLESAVQESKQAEIEYTRALENREILEARLAGLRSRRRRGEIREQNAIIAAQQDFLNQATLDLAGEGRLDATDEEKNARAVILQRDAFLARAEAIRAENPLLARQLELMAELETTTGQFINRNQIVQILDIDSLNETVRLAGVTLGKLGQISSESVDDAMADAANTFRARSGLLVAAGEDAGEQVGRALARRLALSIRTEEEDTVRELRASLARVIAEGRAQIQESILSAKSSLFDIGGDLSTQIAQLIDAGPAGQRIRALQEQLDASREAGQRGDLQQGLRDAQRELARAREQLDPTRSIGLTAAQRRRRAADIEDFLRPFREKVQDAQRELKDFNTQNLIDQLEDSAEKQKQAATRGIDDTIAAFVSGQIRADEANRRLAQILQRAAPDYQTSGRVLGIRFRQGFEGTLQSIREQVAALVGFVDRAGTPRQDVVRPAQTVAEVRARTLQANQELQQAQLRAQRRNNELTQEILAELKKGVPQRRAVGKAIKGSNDRLESPGGPGR